MQPVRFPVSSSIADADPDALDRPVEEPLNPFVPADSPAAHALVPDAELIRRFDVAGPRYTSYPTADRFVDGHDAAAHRAALGRVGRGPAAAPLSLYVHVPFCAQLCYYCACNKVVTRRYERAVDYLDGLEREIALVRAALPGRQGVSQLHLGGGSPTFLRDPDLERLVAMLGDAFDVLPRAERSIEIDPRTVDAARMRRIAALGFDRISLGVQDFDLDVQQAVHRVQPEARVFGVTEAAREAGVSSVNVDLIYGLPKQSVESLARTLATVGRLRPDRIALYGYAHLPDRFKPQRRIDSDQLPAASVKVAMLQLAIERLGEAGYEYIGMDHFALPDDPLAVAKRQGRLHRNFQGYTTQPDRDLVALGVSAISRIGPTYAQNHRTIDEWRAAVDAGELPVARGIALTRDDLLRRTVIMALMCQGEVCVESIEVAHLIDFRERFADELEDLDAYVEIGLVEFDGRYLRVTDRGWFFVRAIAMLFDRPLREGRARAAFSRIL